MNGLVANTSLTDLQSLWAPQGLEGLLQELEAKLGIRARLVLFDPPRDSLASTEDTAAPDRLLHWMRSQRTACWLTGERFRHDFSDRATQPAYRQMGSYGLLPLIAKDQHLGCIEIIRPQLGLGEEQAVFFPMLATLAAEVLARGAQGQAFSEHDETLQRQRSELQVLVDVTNTVLSTLDLKDQVLEVAKELRRYFGIDHVGLELLDPEGGACQVHEVLFRFNGKHQQGCRSLPQEAVLGRQALQRGGPWLAGEQDLQQLAYGLPAAARLLEEGMTSACSLPLRTGRRSLGTLTLALRQSAALLADRLPLLQQVAARIALGLGNALAYQEITRLKDQLASENRFLEDEIRHYQGFDEIVAQSEAMASVLEQVQMVAASDCSVLILGETGTGKELIARAIHKNSMRKAQRMVTVSCAAIPAGLLESDLFGHEKGAFTGAVSQRLGRFEMADRGTLFLDEVGDIQMELQPKLLRVLQEREIERVGGERVIPVDVRLIAATCRDLRQMVAKREYRSDLYYRLNVFPIIVPPLRERPEDIPLLARFFTQKIARRMGRQIEGIPDEAMKRLVRHTWPGNVRELQNVIERAVILSRGPQLNVPLAELNALPLGATLQEAQASPQARLQDTDGSESERERIIRVLHETRGIVAGARGAAVKLGLKRTTLLSRMQRYGISVKAVIDEQLQDGGGSDAETI